MARGIIFGVVAKSETDKGGLPGAVAHLGGVRGADVAGGSLITTKVPLRKDELGWTETRVAKAFGVFTISFEWDPAVDIARASGIPVMKVTLTAWKDKTRSKGKMFSGPAALMLDVGALLDTIKNGTAIQTDGTRSVLNGLTKEMKKAITGEEFESVHRRLLSTEQHAIVGVLGCVLDI